MTDNSLWLRLIAYVITLLCIAVVYVGQKHDTADATIHAAARKAGKWLLWSVAGVIVMRAIFWLFID